MFTNKAKHEHTRTILISALVHDDDKLVPNSLLAWDDWQFFCQKSKILGSLSEQQRQYQTVEFMAHCKHQIQIVAFNTIRLESCVVSSPTQKEITYLMTLTTAESEPENNRFYDIYKKPYSILPGLLYARVLAYDIVRTYP